MAIYTLMLLRPPTTRPTLNQASKPQKFFSIMSDLPTSIPLGSWILVTGASGFLASHIIIQFLQRGFKVRGAVRDPNQSSWLLEGRFKSYAESGALELVAVQDLGADGAYDEAMKGMTAVAHTAYVTDIVPDPNKVITPLVNSVRSIFNAALHEPSVKEVLLTSGATAATPLDQKTDNGTVTRDTWNDAVLEVAWAPPPYGMSHAMANYTASKTASEKEFWKLVEGKDLPFNVNVVAPAGIIGEPLHPKHVGGPASWIVHAYRGNKTWMDPMPACKLPHPANAQTLKSKCSPGGSILCRGEGPGIAPRRSHSGPERQARATPKLGPQHPLQRSFGCTPQAPPSKAIRG